MERLDCLFLHIPKLIGEDRPKGRSLSINTLPIGLLGMADLLHRSGVKTQIVHLGVELLEDPDFSAVDDIKEKRPRIVAIPLHWHHQSYDVMELVKRIKAAFPALYVLLGGFTASFFHEEIMRNFDGVDGIIRGEAERPILELVQGILAGKDDFFSIPNLTWRRKKHVLINPLSYVADPGDLNGLSFTHLTLLKNYATYIRYAGQPGAVKSLIKGKGSRQPASTSPLFPLMVGRGCPVQCTWCSGNIPSQNTITGRTEVTFRGEEKVVQLLHEALAYGYKRFHMSFDPAPQHPEYFLRLFKRIREEKLSIDCIFESFGLPTLDFIKAFKATFPGPNSLIVLSPDVGSDRVRKIHKGHAFTNLALRESLDRMKEHGVLCDLFFTVGVPFETKEDVEETIRLQREIRRGYRNVKGLRTYTLDMEPGSPWHVDPEAFGVETSLRNFTDYYHFHGEESRVESSLGYWIPDYFPGVKGEKEFKERLEKIACRCLCFTPGAPQKDSASSWGRKICDLSTLFRKAKPAAGSKS